MSDVRNEAGERPNPSVFVGGRQSPGQEPVPVPCLDVLRQTRGLARGRFFTPGMEKREKEGVDVVRMVVWSSRDSEQKCDIVQV